MGILKQQLTAYCAGSLYPMHMPGHKRRLSPEPDLPYLWDLTEVEGTDDLHDADGILKSAMERTARLYSAARTWYLVNGSTCGLLAAIRALAPFGSEITVARNCHKSVYHAIELGNLQPHYLIPPADQKFGIYGSICPEDVKSMLNQHPNTACVVITSPTYEGVISDISAISRICHSYHVPLIVDEAHGAHLGLFPGWPDSAVHLGADLVIQSAHKTLPSLTQTAFLHMPQGSLANPEEVERQLDIFETSSPSYPLMASLDSCTQLLAEKGSRLFSQWRENLLAFDREIEPMQLLQVIGHSPHADSPCFYDFDPGKLPICCGHTRFTAADLAEALRKQFSFETEMAWGVLNLAMTSPADSRQALLNFGNALKKLDQAARPHEAFCFPAPPVPCAGTLSPGQAARAPACSVSLSCAAGNISGEYIWAYPPGVPIIAPGERITPTLLSYMEAMKKSGTVLHHSRCKKPQSIQILS